MTVFNKVANNALLDPMFFGNEVNMVIEDFQGDKNES